MIFNKITTLALILILFSCNNQNPSNSKKEVDQSFQNKGHELVYNMVQKVGNYNQLMDKKDVSYTYSYTTPDGKQDISTEKYIFDGELSYGLYNKHERTMPQLEGPIEQGYNGSDYWLKHNGKKLTDAKLLKRVVFSRPTNFYWFTMMQKLLDPGLNYKYLGEKEIDNDTYEIVKITFNGKDDKPKDIYQLYLNKKTLLVDQFLFTVAEFGVVDVPFLMRLEYENVDGLLIPTKRKYKPSNWKADPNINEGSWILVDWSDIKFNTNLAKEIFEG